MRCVSRNVVLAMIVAVAAAAPVGAQDQSDKWQFQIAPLYLWAVNVDGTMTVRDVLDNDFSVDFSDAISNLEMAFTVHFEARKGRWGLLADASYLNFSGTQDIDTPGQEADIEVENMLLEGAAGYEFSDRWWGSRYDRRSSRPNRGRISSPASCGGRSLASGGRSRVASTSEPADPIWCGMQPLSSTIDSVNGRRSLRATATSTTTTRTRTQVSNTTSA